MNSPCGSEIVDHLAQVVDRHRRQGLAFLLGDDAEQVLLLLLALGRVVRGGVLGYLRDDHVLDDVEAELVRHVRGGAGVDERDVVAAAQLQVVRAGDAVEVHALGAGQREVPQVFGRQQAFGGFEAQLGAGGLFKQVHVNS